MECLLRLKRIPWVLLSALLVLLSACKEEEIMPLDNSLRVLITSVDGERIVPPVDGTANEPVLELLFSHSLNTDALSSAISLAGPGGNVDLELTFSDANSVVTIAGASPLDYEASYTLSIPAGTYGAEGEELTQAYELSFNTAPFVPVNLTLEADVAVFSEDAGQVTIKGVLSEATTEDVEGILSFTGSATPEVDYSLTGMSLSIPEGETEATIVLTGIQDGDIEGSEEIIITLTEVINAEELTPQELTLVLDDDDLDSNGDGVPDQGFIINEVLYDPPGGDAGDANGDGTRSASEDEFIEFVNDSDREVDLSGFTLFDTDQLGTDDPRHVFPDGTIIPPGGVYVLFGGGNPTGDFGVAQVAASSTGNMNLNNADDAITIFDTEGTVFLTFDTQVEGAGISFGENQSVTRVPDINGDFALHTSTNPDLDYSPGKRADGADFPGGGAEPGLGFLVNEIMFDPASGDEGDANGDGTRSARDDEFIEFINDSPNPVDLSGFTLYDDDQLGTDVPRHTFPEGTVIPPGGVFVLFGGGTPTGDFGGSLVQATTTGNMNLNNSGDAITIFDTDGNVFFTFSSEVDGAGLDFGDNQSITRSPDITGAYVLHTTANPALIYSPGVKADGSNF
jgi:hypothetical protein